MTLTEHIDNLDRIVDGGASKPEIRSQIAFIGREVAVLEAENARLIEAYTELEKGHAELKNAHTALNAAQSAPATNAPSKISEGEISMLKLLAASGGRAILEEMAPGLGMSMIEAKYFINKLAEREFAYCAGSVTGRGERLSILNAGTAYIVENGLMKNLPPPAPSISEFDL